MEKENKTSSKVRKVAAYVVIACALFAMISSFATHNWAACVWSFNAALLAFASIQSQGTIDFLMEELEGAWRTLSNDLLELEKLKSELKNTQNELAQYKNQIQ